MSNEATATPEDTVPNAPAGLTATPGNTIIALSWTAAGGATAYNVYRAATTGGEGTTTYASGLTATEFTDSGLTNGTAYYYTVAAVNEVGTSAQSAEATATPSVAAGSVTIDCGSSSSYTDREGVTWAADTDSTGGSVLTTSATISGVSPACRPGGKDLGF